MKFALLDPGGRPYVVAVSCFGVAGQLLERFDRAQWSDLLTRINSDLAVAQTCTATACRDTAKRLLQMAAEAKISESVNITGLAGLVSVRGKEYAEARVALITWVCRAGSWRFDLIFPYSSLLS